MSTTVKSSYKEITDLSRKTGLVAAYNMQAVNGEVLDISGKGNKGIIHGVLDVKGLRGRALRFNSGDVQIFDDPIFNITTNLSVSLLVKNDEESPSSNQVMIGKYDFATNKAEWLVHVDTSAKLRIYFSPDGTVLDYWQSTNALTWNIFNQILFTYNAGTVVVYLNGVLLAGGWNGAGINSINNDDEDIYMGYLHDVGNYWEGIIDECRIWDRTLSPAEAKEEWNKTASQVIFSFNVKDEQRGNHPPVGWSDENGNIVIGQDADGLYVQASGGSDVLSWRGVDLSNFKKSGFVKQIKGDMDFDGNMAVDSTGRISFSDNILSIAFNADEKLRSILVVTAVRSFDDGRSWAQKMVDSYKFLHGTLPDGVEEELLSRLQPGKYLYNTFGPDGQNKSVCDFVLAFKFTDDIGQAAGHDYGFVKSGDTLRWDADGTVYPQNNLPNHEIGGGDGILTVSTTDGWGGLTEMDISGNPFSGTMPHWTNAGLTALTILELRSMVSFTGDLSRFAGLINLTFFNPGSGRLGGVSGDIAHLSKLTKMERLYVHTCYNIYGDVANLAGMISCIEMDLRYANYKGDPEKVVYGNVSAFENMPNLTTFNMRGINLTGDLSSFAGKDDLYFF